jgi:phosphatidylcholine synthase
MAVLVVLTFVPFHVLHPVRVVRLRWLTLSLIGVWTALVMVALINDFEVGVVVKAVLCLIALYIVGCDSAIRLVRSLNA